MSDLADAVAAAVGSLGAAHVTTLADAYRTCDRYSAVAARVVRQAVPAVHHSVVDRVNTAWEAQPDLSGAAVAVALDAVRAARLDAPWPAVEVVVTGPSSPAAPVRLTSEVLCQLVDRATQRVTIVSYAAYQVGAVIAALDAAIRRGVDVRLILESADHLDGGGGAAAYARYRVFEWPLQHRQPADAKLHAKAVIVDSRDVLLTSANMTNAAYDKNIELGVLCRGGDVARQVQRHFDELITRGILVPVGPGIKNR